MMGAQRPRSVLRLEHVSEIYPTGEVLRNVTWEVKPGDRIGLVGVNGAGKSTQMRLIAGQEEPSSGHVVRQGEPRIAYLQQSLQSKRGGGTDDFGGNDFGSESDVDALSDSD